MDPGLARSPHALTHDIFVGRHDEMGQLTAGLREALSGRGKIFMLAGEPGIGKTRTAHELAAQARCSGAHVLFGRCHEDEGAPAFWPWVQIIRTYLRGRDPSELASETGAAAADIARLVSDVQARVPDLPAPSTLTPAQARFCLFDGIATLFKNAAEQQPLVLIFDDLHCADTPSLRLLQFLARDSGDTRVLVVGTYRETEVNDVPALIETLAELARQPHFHRLHLRGLREEEVGQLIELTAGVQPSPSLVARLHRETEGNPFFMREIVSSLLSEGRIANGAAGSSWHLRLPDDLQQVLAHRLHRLSSECHDVLTIASVIGKEFNFAALEQVTTLARDRLLDALAEAVETSIISEGAGGPGYFKFRHSLIRQTLYQDLSAGRRMRLHRRVGAALEALYGADSESHLAALAYHFSQAAPVGDLGRAIDYTARAGRRALALLAYEEAADQFERALQLLDLTAPVDELQRCELLLNLGNAQRGAGETAAAERSFRRAADIARLRTAPEYLARAALGMGTSTDPLGVDRDAIATLEEALRVLGTRDSALRALVLGRLASGLYGTAAEERRTSLSDEAVAVARRIGDPEVLAWALIEKRTAQWGPANVTDRLAEATEIVRLATDVGDKHLALTGHIFRMTDLLERGDIAAMNRDLEAQDCLAREVRHPLVTQYAACFGAMRARLEGRFVEAEQLAQEALAIGLRARDPAALQKYGVHTLEVRRATGQLQDMVATVVEFVAQHPGHPIWRCGLAWLHSEMGHEADARRDFEQLAANDFSDLPRDVTWLNALALLAEVCSFLGDTRRAAPLYRFMRPYAGHNVVAAAVSCLGSVSHFLGQLATTMSAWTDAVRHFEEALDMHIRMGARPLVGSTQHAYAAMLLRRGKPGDRPQALELLEAALVTADALNMKHLSEKVLATKRGAAAATSQAVDMGASRVTADHTTRNGVSSASPDATTACTNGTSIFHREGEYWTIGHDGNLFRLKDSLGLRYLAVLLSHPGREFLAVDLVSIVHGHETHTATRSDGLTTCGLGDAGDILDPTTKAAYKHRIDDLREDLEEATRCNDGERAARTQAEIDMLAQELARGVGLGGRHRKAASIGERARINVTRTIKDAVKRITRHDAALGRHLAATIRTGTFCSYAPDPRVPVAWEI